LFHGIKRSLGRRSNSIVSAHHNFSETDGNVIATAVFGHNVGKYIPSRQLQQKAYGLLSNNFIPGSQSSRYQSIAA
jgi:hypothetical protein